MNTTTTTTDVEWMHHPDRPCASPADATPTQIRDHADRWFPRIDIEPAYARQLCAGCPVKNQCAQAGLAHPDNVGIWGGYTENELNNLRNKRPRKNTAA